MNIELEYELYDIDHIFFKEAIACEKGEMNEMNTCMAFGCECGDGWFEPIKTFVKKTKILNDLGKKYNVQFICNQLKEKFGEIRIYASTEKINVDEDFVEGYEILNDMFHDAISACEIACTKVCEKCGADGGYNNENIICTPGYINYICKDCARKNTEDGTKFYDEHYKDNEFYGIDRITLFKGENAFLQLNHVTSFEYNDHDYNSIIHAYFSEVDPEHAKIYHYISTSKSKDSAIMITKVAKSFGFDKITDFELLKNIVRAKFTNYWNSTIRQDLFLTKHKMLIDMNNLHDNILGYCYCKNCKDVEKQNNYGKILMEVREELFESICESFDSIEAAEKFIEDIRDTDLKLFEGYVENISHLKKYYVAKKTPEKKDWVFKEL